MPKTGVKQYFCNTKVHHTREKKNVYFSIFRFSLQFLNTSLLLSSLLCLFFSFASEEKDDEEGIYGYT